MAKLRTRCLPFILWVLVLGLGAWAYLPGVQGPSLLDDHSSLKPLVGLQENPQFAWEYISSEKSGPTGRPLAMATFVIERVVFGDDIAVTKAINIAIHLVNGVLVAWLLILLMKPLPVPAAATLAVLLAAVWLLSPLWVSTVLYAVQRMALLSTSCMLLALVSYCYCRAWIPHPRRFAVSLVLPLFFVVLGVFTKENAVAVIPVILVLELLWFQCREPAGGEAPWLKQRVLLLILSGAVAMTLLLVLRFDSIAGSFSGRDFTLPERLMTQARVLWDYLGQLLWPSLDRMGIYHDDYPVSRSLVSPATTLPAILCWSLLIVCVVCVAFSSWSVGKMLALVPAWYLLGHSVESTVLPLELYFEHRNYFPAMGLLLLPILLYVQLARLWPQMVRPILTYTALTAVLLLLMTSSQAQVWSSRELLAFNHISGHPNSFRANTDMAVIMASVGDYDRAAEYSARANAVNPHRRRGDYSVRNLALACIAGQGAAADDVAALEASGRRPITSSLGLVVLVRMLEEDRCPDFDRVAVADALARLYLGPRAPAVGNRSVYLGLALLENALQRFQYADQYIDLYLERAPGNVRALLMKLHFSVALRDQQAVDKLILQLQQLDAAGRLSERQRQTLALYMEN